MNEAVFSAASVAAMAGWLALAVAVLLAPGRARAALLVIGGRVVPAALCVTYTGLLVAHWGSAPGGGFQNLAGVLALFAVPGKMLGAWVHFLVFDLLVGRWIVDDVLAHARPRALLALVLPATFLYGPLGLLAYVLLRAALPGARGRAFAAGAAPP